MRPARRLPNGAWQPWAADLLEGLMEAQRLRALGLHLDLDHGELAALGQVTADARDGQDQATGPQYWHHEPTLNDKARRILDRIVAEREAMYSSHTPTPTRGNTSNSTRSWTRAGARDLESGRSEAAASPAPSAVDPGRGDIGSGVVQRNRGKVAKKTTMEKILAESRDDVDFEDG